MSHCSTLFSMIFYYVVKFWRLKKTWKNVKLSWKKFRFKIESLHIPLKTISVQKSTSTPPTTLSRPALAPGRASKNKSAITESVHPKSLLFPSNRSRNPRFPEPGSYVGTALNFAPRNRSTLFDLDGWLRRRRRHAATGAHARKSFSRASNVSHVLLEWTKWWKYSDYTPRVRWGRTWSLHSLRARYSLLAFPFRTPTSVKWELHKRVWWS